MKPRAFLKCSHGAKYTVTHDLDLCHAYFMYQKGVQSLPNEFGCLKRDHPKSMLNGGVSTVPFDRSIQCIMSIVFVFVAL